MLGTPTVSFIFLMRHENLVARVYVSGHEDAVPEDLAADIAQAAADRMLAALGTKVPASPSPSGHATSPLASVDPDALAEILEHVPAALREQCQADAASTDNPAQPGELVEVECSSSDDATVAFELYDTVGSIDAAYDQQHQIAEILSFDYSGDSCTTGSYDGTWRIGDQEAGRLVCFDAFGSAPSSGPMRRRGSIDRRPHRR
jgi:hypothetical protein